VVLFGLPLGTAGPREGYPLPPVPRLKGPLGKGYL